MKRRERSAEVFAEHARWGKELMEKRGVPPLTWTSRPGPKPHDRIRVGYVP